MMVEKKSTAERTWKEFVQTIEQHLSLNQNDGANATRFDEVSYA